MRRASLD